MKKLFAGFSFLLGSIGSHAAYAQQPLAGTAWQGVVNVPDPTVVVFQFKRDTLLVIEQASRQVIETLRYVQKGDQWTWYKLSGNSPCNEQTPGLYTYKIQKDELLIHLIKDGCEARAGALRDTPLKKITWPAP
jgi:hypothetical protein